jgi:superoxide dismutase, Fe-Mn family
MDVAKPVSISPPQFARPESLRVRPLLLKPQWMNGLSERLLVSHYENHYGGALRRLNAIGAHLATLDWAHTPVFEINGLKREELIAASSVILHEIYFDSLGRLVNQWAPDHAHNLPDATPILALDMYEHAYHLDFGAKAAAYVDQVMANLNWERIGARYRLAIGEGADQDKFFLPYGSPAQEEARISAEELKVALQNDDNHLPVLLDLCLPRDLPRRKDMLAGATMHAPAALSRWVEELPRDRPIVAYCICGFQVSGRAVNELRQRGYEARALVGGITAWHAIGGTTVPLDTSTYEETS